MNFSMLKSSATGNKDIGAFYGVNRTNKINDYQMSDLKNVDCENFPYLATRRERELFYNAQEMAVICHDTDIENDYEVTGVTKDGNFVYRGEFINCYGELVGNKYMCEYMGDYVFFPNMQCITSQQTAERRVDEVCSLLPAYKDHTKRPPVWPSFGIGAVYASNKASNVITFSASVGHMTFSFSGGGKIISDAHNLIASGGLSAGRVFAMEFCTSLSDEVRSVSPRPRNVVIVIDSVRVFGQRSIYGGPNEECSLENYLNEELYSGYIQVSFKVYTTEGEEFCYVDYINEHKDEFIESLSYSDTGSNVCGIKFDDSTITVNLGYWGTTGPGHIYTIVKLLECNPAMYMGATYGGRFFACDVFGVDVFYSSGSGVISEKYNFTPGTALGGAGAVQCADSGKWTALKAYGGALYAFKRNGMYRIYSSDGLNFYMDKVCDVGAVSQNAVCVVSDVMYFLSETGLYRFTGTYPEELPDNLGRHYTDGVLGGYDNKLYASLEYSEGRELVIYDAQVSAFGVHDDFDAVNFVTYGGKLYGLNSADGYVYEMSGERKSCEFSIITRKFFLGFDKKAINGIRLYFDYKNQAEENFEVFVSYDGGEWERCFRPVTSGKLKYVPIKFKKCDELTVKIQGTGVFTLKGMTLSLYSGGDIRQNK